MENIYTEDVVKWRDKAVIAKLNKGIRFQF